MAKIFNYSTVVKETLLDSFGHVNNAAYFILLEDARWELLNENHYGLKKIKESGQAPVVLEANIKFMRELQARDEIIIRTEVVSYHKKIGKLRQYILRDEQICCEAEFVMGLFDLRERQLILPTKEWLTAIGMV